MNALVGGGEAIHVLNGILWKHMNPAFAGRIPVGEALKKAQTEADAFLAKNAELVMKVKK